MQGCLKYHVSTHTLQTQL